MSSKNQNKTVSKTVKSENYQACSKAGCSKLSSVRQGRKATYIKQHSIRDAHNNDELIKLMNVTKGK